MSWLATYSGPGGMSARAEFPTWLEAMNRCRIFLEAARPEGTYQAAVISMQRATPEQTWHFPGRHVFQVAPIRAMFARDLFDEVPNWPDREKQ